MDDADAFFTQTIVGPPVTVLLGHRMDTAQLAAEGLRVQPATGLAQLSEQWRSWVLLGHGATPDGRPRRRPGIWRRRLERHALWLAALGLLSLMATLLVVLMARAGWIPLG